MGKRKSVALATLFAMLLPAGLLANHAVKLQNGNWQLIGITGYYSVTGAGSEGTFPDLSNPQGIVDFADDNNHITWDRNSSNTDLTTDVLPGHNFNATSDAPTLSNNPTDGNVQLGLPYHSIVGLRAMKIGSASTLFKAAISYAPPTAPAANNGKDYGASMRTMYIVSPLSKGQPDVMVVYSAQMENQPFKISFKHEDSAWNFSASAPVPDRVYRGVFNHNNTYDSPLTRNNGLTRIMPSSGTTGDTSGYRSLTNTIDMNITDNINENFAELNTSNFQALDGDVTIYRYNPDENLWAEATIQGAGGVGIENLPQVGEKGSPGANNANYGKIKGDFSSWEKGYGYWIKLNKSGLTSADANAGVLSNSQIYSADDYNDKLSAGWNLLSFPDSTLRYATSGAVIPNGTAVVIWSPFGDANVALAAASQANCNTFNADVVARNTAANNVNTLDVRCLWSPANNAVLISDKPFIIQVATADDPVGITSLAGYAFQDTDMFDHNGTGANHGIKTRLGEYAVMVEKNPDFIAATTGLDKTLSVGLPSWISGVNPLVLNGAETATNITGAFTTYIENNAPKPAYDTVSRGQVIGIDSNTTGTLGENMFLFASNSRFYVRDNTYVRLFDTYDTNGSILNITYNGADHKTDEINWITPTMRDCNEIVAGVTGATTEVVVKCLTDNNKTVAFFSDKHLNFDVKEINASAQLLLDRHVGNTADHNESVKGALRAVYQPSGVAKNLTHDATADATSFGSPVTSNLTNSAVWAEDFPNNGALYFMAQHGYKTEAIITAVTSDGTMAANSVGTISWKALDATRNPAEWFNSANDFELFWTEKERGYWVYLEDGYTNPVTVNNVETTAASVVTKHFNNVISNGEGEVFNWFDGYLSSRVGGLVRPGYTSGQSYIVNANVGGGAMAMATTGAVSAGAATFTTYLSDFEVSGFRPTGIHDATVSASDGLGGRNEGNTTIPYVQPDTPTVEFEGNNLVVTSNEVANNVVLYDGNITDDKVNSFIYNGAIADPVDLSTLSTIQYPNQWLPLMVTNSIPDMAAATGTIVKDLRVIAATASATDRLSVFSNMRSINYLPVYSETAHMTATGEGNVTIPQELYNVTLGEQGDSFGVAYRGANGLTSTFVFKPLRKATLADGTPMHADLHFGGVVAQVQFLPEYEGQVFYVYDGLGKWYYGIFPAISDHGTPEKKWGDAGYRLDLVEVTDLEQKL